MRMLLFISFLAMSLCTSAQNHTVIDSLTARLETNLHDTSRIVPLNKLAWQLKFSNSDTAIALSSEALSIAENFELIERVGYTKAQLGTFFSIRGDYLEGLKFYNAGLEINRRLGKEGIVAEILGNIGIVYHQQANYARALAYYLEALAMDEKLGDERDVARHLGNIGNVYTHQNNNEKALKYYFKGLKIAKKIDSKKAMARNFGNIGIIYSKQNKRAMAIEYYVKSLKMNTELDRKPGMIANLGNIANIYMDQADSAAQAGEPESGEVSRRYYAESLQALERALILSEELGDKKSISQNIGNIGKVHAELGEYALAEEKLLEAIGISRNIHARLNLQKQYHMLSLLYEMWNRPSEGYKAYKLHIVYRDSISNEENIKAQTRTEMKYEYEKAELVKEQEELEAARVLDEATSRRDNLQYSVILITLMVIGILLMVIGRFPISIRVAEGLIFFSFLILFEFLLVLADPYIDVWSGGAPGIKLLFNAGIAALIFPAHAFFESKFKSRLVKP